MSSLNDLPAQAVKDSNALEILNDMIQEAGFNEWEIKPLGTGLMWIRSRDVKTNDVRRMGKRKVVHFAPSPRLFVSRIYSACGGVGLAFYGTNRVSNQKTFKYIERFIKGDLSYDELRYSWVQLEQKLVWVNNLHKLTLLTQDPTYVTCKACMKTGNFKAALVKK